MTVYTPTVVAKVYMAAKLRRLFVCFVGMLGLRIDRSSFSATYIAWVVVFLVTAYAYGHLFLWGGIKVSVARPWAIGYATTIWVLYYGGLSVVLGTPVKRWIVQRWGEENATRGFNAMLGIIFMHQGLAQGAIIDCWIGSITGVHEGLMKGAAIAMIVIGTSVKLWATYASSLDIYYYNDMFTGRPITLSKEAISSGPFRWFKNPMYGVGNLQGYGSALLVGSWPGLVVAGAFHITVYAFYFKFERPFVERTYAQSGA